MRKIHKSRKGHGLWFGTQYGISYYDPLTSSGQATFTSFTQKDGLAGEWVHTILEDHKGHLWVGFGQTVGQIGGGVSHYNGSTWTTFSTLQLYTR